MRRLPQPSDDRGLGMITVIIIMSLIGSLAVTATALTISNLGNSSRDRQALSALATSEAGVAQAIQFLRGGNLATLTCLEPPPGAGAGATCQGPGPSWTSATSPMQVRLDGAAGGCVSSADCFKVWIGQVSPFIPNCSARTATPPGQCYGRYRIHSTGISGNGPGARRTAVDVQVSPYRFPLGVFSEQGFSGNGNVGIHRESIFTLGCMVNRQDDSRSGSGTQFEYDPSAGRTRLDLFYDQPAAAHAVGDVSTSNRSCGSGGGGGPIHASLDCNVTFPFDQDGSGGDLTATGPGRAAANSQCRGKYVRADGSSYPLSSRFTVQDMQNIGYRPRGLSDAEYDRLKVQAQAQGTYNIPPGSLLAKLDSLVASGVNSPVLYWDNGPVSLSSSNFPSSFLRNLNDTAGCPQNSVTLVVTGPNSNGGNGLSYQGGNTAPFLVASIFVPDGTLTGSGGRNTIGTVYAKVIDLGGNIDFHLDKCFTNNPPGGVLDVEVTGFREDDSTDVN